MSAGTLIVSQCICWDGGAGMVEAFIAPLWARVKPWVTVLWLGSLVSS